MLQRANNLSKELQRHGFAESPQEAFDKAEKICNKGQLTNGAVSTEALQQPSTLNQIYDRLHKLERQTSFSQGKESETHKQMSELISKMNEIIKSIQLIEMNQVSFEKQIENLGEAPVHDVKPSPEPVVSQPEPQPAPPQVQESPGSREEVRQNSAVGDSGYEQSDIAIDKIFYFGKK